MTSWDTEWILKVGFVFHFFARFHEEKSKIIWTELNYAEQFRLLYHCEGDWITALETNSFGFVVEVDWQFIEIDEVFAKMDNHSTTFDILNEGLRDMEIGVGLIDNKPIFDCNDVVLWLYEADIFVVVEDAIFFAIYDFDVVVENHFPDSWGVIVDWSLDELHP